MPEAFLIRDRLKEIRDFVYDLLVNCIPGSMIISEITREVINYLDSSHPGEEKLPTDIVYFAAMHETKMHMGQKEIMHIEAFIAKVMLLFREFKESYARK